MRIWRWLWTAGTAMAAAVPVAAAEQAAHGEEHAINWFTWGGHAPPLGYMFINFAVLLVVVYWLLRKPIATRVTTRRDALVRALEEAAAAFDKARADLEEAQRRAEGLEEELTAMRQDVVAQARAQADRIVEDARARAERMLADASALIALETAQATRRLQREVAEAVVARTREVLAEAITEADHRSLTAAYVSEVEHAVSTEK